MLELLFAALAARTWRQVVNSSSQTEHWAVFFGIFSIKDRLKTEGLKITINYVKKNTSIMQTRILLIQ